MANVYPRYTDIELSARFALPVCLIRAYARTHGLKKKAELFSPQHGNSRRDWYLRGEGFIEILREMYMKGFLDAGGDLSLATFDNLEKIIRKTYDL